MVILVILTLLQEEGRVRTCDLIGEYGFKNLALFNLLLLAHVAILSGMYRIIVFPDMLTCQKDTAELRRQLTGNVDHLRHYVRFLAKPKISI